MDRKLEEKLFEKYPDIFFQKDLDMKSTCMCWGIECGDGWYNIIDILCSLIQHEIKQFHAEIERYTLYMKTEDKNKRPIFIERLNQVIESLTSDIQAVQVKEKFGTLRFYTNMPHEKIDAYIDFAEIISETTCEICGNPGTINDGGWLKVRCQEHKQCGLY